jgi:hypothetical protein
MEHRVKFAAACLVAVAVAAAAIPNRSKQLCDGFLPKNDMKIPVGDMRALGIDEATFNKTLDRVEAVYGPIVAQKGAALKVNRLWTDPTVNASAEQQGKTWIINMYGGLARHKAVTGDGFALVACHELGHHLGGVPLYGGDDWASNEGQSDYFGTLKCLRLVGASAAVVEPTAKKACAAQWSSASDQAQCEAAAMAGVSLAELLGALGGSGKPSLDTPDPSQVGETSDWHPDAQCRLDTYFAGGLCSKSVSQDVSRTDHNAGTCTAENGDSAGLRPRCWYKPPVPAPNPAVAALSQTHQFNEKGVRSRLKSLRAALAGGR